MPCTQGLIFWKKKIYELGGLFGLFWKFVRHLSQRSAQFLKKTRGRYSHGLTVYDICQRNPTNGFTTLEEVFLELYAAHIEKIFFRSIELCYKSKSLKFGTFSETVTYIVTENLFEVFNVTHEKMLSENELRF